jgi:glycosyltransferase involved in cell wall biosynthesis
MRRLLPARPPVSFIAWSSVSGRSSEIAKALGGEAKCFYDFGFVSRPLVPVRYAASAVRTLLYLLRRRPRAVIATNPPVFPSLIAFLYGRLTGAPIVLDSHPVAFGFYEHKRFVTLMPLHRWLMPRVRASIVTVDELVAEVEREGGRAEIVHEAPPLWTVAPAGPIAGRPVVLFVGIFASDEPVELIVAAARALPDVDVRVTGDLRKCPPPLLEDKPPNLELTGFLGPEDYRAAIAGAHVVMTLTTRPESVDRGANEAVFARRPLIVSDWPAARRYFPYAVHVPNTEEGVVAGINEALGRYDHLRRKADLALAEQQGRWERQLETLRSLLSPEPARRR